MSTLQHVEAEQAVLGAIMLDPGALERVQGIIEASAFVIPRHVLIFEAMRALAAAGSAIDAVTIGAYLDQQGRFAEAGGLDALLALDTAGTAVNVEHHARIVRDAHTARQFVERCMLLSERCRRGDFDSLDGLLGDAHSAFTELSVRRGQNDMRPMASTLDRALNNVAEAMTRPGGIIGTSTGFVDLDQRTKGLQPGSVTVIGGRPSMGKTAFATALAAAVGGADGTSAALVFSLEQPTDQLVLRMLAADARVDSSRVRAWDVTLPEYELLMKRIAAMRDWRIAFDDTPGQTVAQMRAKAARFIAHHPDVPVGIIIIDYLQLIRSTGRTKNREQEVNAICVELQNFARDLAVPLVVLSQLNREVEKRAGNRPVMSDLRDSGAIEQVADLIAFLHRPEYYDRNTDEKGIAEVIIVKQRNGPIGTVKLRFKAEWARFDNLAGGWQ